MRPRSLVVALVCGLGLVLAACNAMTDRGGVPRTAALTVGVPASEASGLTDAFVTAVEKRSQGRLSVRVVPAGQTGLDVAGAVRDGTVDLGWVPSRYLAELGMPQFQALTAPMLVTSAAAQRAVTAPAVAEPFLAATAGSGLVGVGLVPGELRRPVAAGGALLGPDSYAGRTIRALDEVQVATFEALGGTAVERRESLADGLASGTFEGAEVDAATLLAAATDVSITSNVVLWPKPWLVAASQSSWDRLPPEDQAALRAAAYDAQAAAGPMADAAAVVGDLCAQGIASVAATPTEVEQLRRAVAPVVEQLRSEPAVAPLLAAVEQTVAAVPGVDTLPESEGCAGSTLSNGPALPVPLTRSTIPPGTYRMRLSPDDMVELGLGDRTNDAQVVTLVINADGSYTSTSRFDDGEELVFEAGQVFGDSQVVHFVNDIEAMRRIQAGGTPACVWTDPGAGCTTNETPYSLRWELLPDESVQFSDARGMSNDPVVVAAVVANPYVRVK